MLVIFDNIRSTHNVGSFFRTADAAGFKKIYLCGITPAPLDDLNRENKRLTKVSLGAENFVKWEKVDSVSKLIDDLKKENYKIFAIELDKKAIPYFQVKLTNSEKQKTALIFGNEVEGISTEILEKCDKIIEIPMRGQKESLNVSVTFGIIAFHFLNC